jgi:hypothetical protein
MAMIYVPFAFIIMYPFLRLAMRPAYARSPFFATLTAPWLPGVVVAVILLFGGEHLGRLFVPLMRLFG